MVARLALGALFLPLMPAGRTQTLELDSFAQPGAQGAVLPTSTWAGVGNVIRLTDAIAVTGAAMDDNGWGASGLTVDARTMGYVTIVAQSDVGNQAGALVFQLEDAALRTHTVAVPTAQFAPGVRTTVQVPLGAWPAPTVFDAARITGWTLGGGTLGLVPFRMTLDQLALTATGGVVAPAISLQPLDRLIGVGESTTLTVAATGGQFTYRWTLNGVELSGANGPTLALANTTAANSGAYQVEVTNSAGLALSRQASVVVVNLRASQALAATATPSYEPGSTVTVRTTLTYGDGLGAVALQVRVPAGWTWVEDAGSGADARPAAGATGTLEWRWAALPAGGSLSFTYTLAVPSNAKDAQVLAAGMQVAQGGLAGQISVNPAPLLLPLAARPHSADVNGDFRLSLLELTRVIELYNTRVGTVRSGAYRVDSLGEDGFAADAARAKGPAATLLGRYHAADSDRDGSLDLFELLRVIQLFNHRTLDQVRTGQYRVVASGSEDGYEPGP